MIVIGSPMIVNGYFDDDFTNTRSGQASKAIRNCWSLRLESHKSVTSVKLVVVTIRLIVSFRSPHVKVSDKHNS